MIQIGNRYLQPFEKLVGVRGFEPPPPSSRTRCATRLRYTPMLNKRNILGLLYPVRRTNSLGYPLRNDGIWIFVNLENPCSQDNVGWNYAAHDEYFERPYQPVSPAR